MSEFQVNTQDISQRRVIDVSIPSIEVSSALRVAVEKFAFTSNNISYAVTGDRLRYWDFFPPRAAGSDGWGMIPVWGFAEVVESTCPDVTAGERLYGYFPPATQLILNVAKVRPGVIMEGSEHRRELPAAYNTYRRLQAEPGYDAATDNERMLYTPLFVTSWCLWDCLKHRAWVGASQIVIVSASSKTGIGFAQALHNDPDTPPVVGLTSTQNMPAVMATGTCDTVTDYSEIHSLDATRETVVVDMSGNAAVLGRLSEHFGNNLSLCLNVGLTHWSAAGRSPAADRSEFFFAPTHIQQRVSEWGAAEFDQRVGRFVSTASAEMQNWIDVKTIAGLSGLQQIYPDVCAGKIAANEALVVQLRG